MALMCVSGLEQFVVLQVALFSLKTMEITNKVNTEDSGIGYILEPKEKLLERTFPRAWVAMEQCNLEDPAIIERVMVGEIRVNKNRNAKKWRGGKKRLKDE